MIIEERNYTLHAGKLNEWIAAMMPDGIRIQQSVLGHLIGYFHTEVGSLNQIVHMWAYDSFEDRMARRAMLDKTEGWPDVRKKLAPLIQSQWNRILMPTLLSPIK